jgi:hypothetical protein
MKRLLYILTVVILVMSFNFNSFANEIITDKSVKSYTVGFNSSINDFN